MPGAKFVVPAPLQPAAYRVFTSTSATSAGDITPLVWSAWNHDVFSVTSDELTSSTNDFVWRVWMNATSTALTLSNEQLWQNWNSNVLLGTAMRIHAPAPPPSPEVLAERARLDAEARERSARIAAEAAAARDRAEQLLVEHLTPQQREQLRANGYFEVEVAGKTYRIRRGRAGNVRQVIEGREKLQLCIHPTEMVPDADTMLAQKLLLEADEESFLRIANKTVLS